MKLFIVETILIVLGPIVGMALSPAIYNFRHLIGILVIGYCLLMAKQFRLPSLKSQLTIPSKKDWLRTAIITLLASLILIAVNKINHQALTELIRSIFNTPNKYLLTLISYPILSVPLQELIFRYFYLQRLRVVSQNKIFLTVFSALVFSLAHLSYRSPLMILGTFILGIWWAAEALKQKSLIPISISHAIIGTLVLWLAINN